MANTLEEFRSYRQRMNDRIMESEHLGIKRFFNLDTAAYRDGALDGKTKELLGLGGIALQRLHRLPPRPVCRRRLDERRALRRLERRLGGGRQHRHSPPEARFRHD
jgi:hypothetical protein